MGSWDLKPAAGRLCALYRRKNNNKVPIPRRTTDSSSKLTYDAPRCSINNFETFKVFGKNFDRYFFLQGVNDSFKMYGCKLHPLFSLF